MRRGCDHSTDTGSTPASGHRPTVHPGGAAGTVTAYPRDGHGRRPPPRTTEARLRQTTDPGQPPRGRPGDGRAAGSRGGRRSVRQPRPVHRSRRPRPHRPPHPRRNPRPHPRRNPRRPRPRRRPQPIRSPSTPRPRRPRQNRRRRPHRPRRARPTRHRSPPRRRRRRPSRRRPRPRPSRHVR